MDCTRSHASITAYVNFRTCTYFLPKKNDSKTIYNNSFDVYNDFLCFRIVFWTFVSFCLSSSDTFLYWFLPYSLFVLFSVYFVFFTIFYCSHNIVLLFIYHLPYDNNNFFIYILLQIFTFLCKPEFFVIYMASSLLIHQKWVL